jgi:Tol biopolymer transport system component
VRTGTQGIARLVVLDLARRTQRTITPRETLLAQPSWSSDGRWIAFTAYDQGLEIQAVRPDGRSRRTVVPAIVDRHGVGHGGSAPAWAPRGGRLAYLAGVNAFRDIYTWSLAVRAANGSRRLLAHDLHGDRAAWSPDGRALAYSTGSDLWSVSATGRGKPLLLQHAPGVSDEPSWLRLR